MGAQNRLCELLAKVRMFLKFGTLIGFAEAVPAFLAIANQSRKSHVVFLSGPTDDWVRIGSWPHGIREQGD